MRRFFFIFLLASTTGLFGQNNGSSLLSEVKRYYDNEDYFRALRLIDEKKTDYAQDQDVTEYYLRILMELKMYEKLEDELKSATLFNPRRFLPYQMEYYYRLGRYDEAKKIGDLYLAQFSEEINLKVHLLFARMAYEVDGDVKGAELIYKRIEVNSLLKNEFLFEYGLFLLLDVNKNKKAIDNIFKIYADSFPDDYTRYYLNALYFYKKNDYNTALDNVNSLLRAKPNNKKYLLFKFQIAQKLDDVELLISMLNEYQDLFPSNFTNYMLGYYRLYNNQNNALAFKIKDKDFLEKSVIPYLKKASESANNEVGDYFLEEILIDNQLNDDLAMAELVNKRQKYIQSLLESGNYDEMYYQISRLVEIDPKGEQTRILFKDYNRFLKRDQTYLEQLKILDQLQTTKDPEVEIKIEKMTKKLGGILLDKKYGVFLDHDFVQDRRIVGLSKNMESVHEHTPGLRAIFFHMLNRFMTLETFMQYKDVRSTEDLYKTDYTLNLELFETENALKGKVTLYDTRKDLMVNNKPFLIEGTGRFYRLMAIMRHFIENNIEIVGTVLKVDKNDVIVSLGYRDGLKLGDKIQIKNKNGTVLATASIDVVNEYISRVKVDISIALRIGAGDLVILLKKEGEAK